LISSEVKSTVEKFRRGRPREAFRIMGGLNGVTMAARRKADEVWSGVASVWILKSRAEVNLIIRELEEARDRAFPD